MKPPPVNAETETAREEPDLTADVLIESEAWQNLPAAEDVARQAVAVAASGAGIRNAELSILLCDDDAIAALSGRWRGQEKPTNVLSFPALPLHGGAALQKKTPLGDIAIAYETLVREAQESGKDRKSVV